MKPTIREETWPYIDQFLRETPEIIQMLPTFQEAIAASEQRVLLRLLRHKFGELPDSVVKQIEATTDSEQLDHWVDQVLDVASLAAMQFGSEPAAFTGTDQNNEQLG
jgi:hypothetical protein